jgi:hypothetical protein
MNKSGFVHTLPSGRLKQEATTSVERRVARAGAMLQAGGVSEARRAPEVGPQLVWMLASSSPRHQHQQHTSSCVRQRRQGMLHETEATRGRGKIERERIK